MKKCEECEKEVVLPFTRTYCCNDYCAEHGLAENHECVNQPTGAPPIKKIAALLLIALILGVALWNAPFIISAIQRGIGWFQPGSTYSREELVNYTLALINSDRMQSGLTNVSLSPVGSGQQHADSMLANGYFSHWDTDGYKPYMRYTLAGGQGCVSENIACLLSSGVIDAEAAIKNLEWQMMYNDSSSAWGHRYNILTPFHNRVSIGVAFDGYDLYLVQDFENNYVDWSTLNVSNGDVVMSGSIQESGLTIQQVAIYYDQPTNLATQQLQNPPYNDGYDLGTYVGMALPPGWKSIGGITITASTWYQTGQSFQIGFSLSQAFNAHGNGVYTLCLQSNLTNTATEDNSLTSYSVWYTA